MTVLSSRIAAMLVVLIALGACDRKHRGQRTAIAMPAPGAAPSAEPEPDKSHSCRGFPKNMLPPIRFEQDYSLLLASGADADATVYLGPDRMIGWMHDKRYVYRSFDRNSALVTRFGGVYLYTPSTKNSRNSLLRVSLDTGNELLGHAEGRTCRGWMTPQPADALTVDVSGRYVVRTRTRRDGMSVLSRVTILDDCMIAADLTGRPRCFFGEHPTICSKQEIHKLPQVPGIPEYIVIAHSSAVVHQAVLLEDEVLLIEQVKLDRDTENWELVALESANGREKYRRRLPDSDFVILTNAGWIVGWNDDENLSRIHIEHRNPRVDPHDVDLLVQLEQRELDVSDWSIQQVMGKFLIIKTEFADVETRRWQILDLASSRVIWQRDSEAIIAVTVDPRGTILSATTSDVCPDGRIADRSTPEFLH